ncbi:unnamed protein product [Dimorphilus gyrociliatus]|uniref:Fork-head domain-containing protein n=1 Tax=Dimorphilus gyrociliatus TaxID=2664684 RepID=A0A7I8VIK0_9ANNE|nr:unnamed protein product [Dimorphilus gyrociliatus]
MERPSTLHYKPPSMEENRQDLQYFPNTAVSSTTSSSYYRYSPPYSPKAITPPQQESPANFSSTLNSVGYGTDSYASANGSSNAIDLSAFALQAHNEANEEENHHLHHHHHHHLHHDDLNDDSHHQPHHHHFHNKSKDNSSSGISSTSGEEKRLQVDQGASSREEVSNRSTEKPPHSYLRLIAEALLDAPEQKLILYDIYNYIQTKYEYYNNEEKGWRNSIRHNLSINTCFVKQNKHRTGKGHYWALHPSCIEDFKNGDFSKSYTAKRVRRRKPAAPLTSTPRNRYESMPMNYGRFSPYAVPPPNFPNLPPTLPPSLPNPFYPTHDTNNATWALATRFPPQYFDYSTPIGDAASAAHANYQSYT